MSRRETVSPTRKEKPGITGDTEVEETHPAFGMIGVSRSQIGPTGSSLFDSDLHHHHTIRVTIRTASRRRDLNRDWIHGEKEFVEIEMSEAQWAAFVSSSGQGDGVPCTIRRREDEVFVPGMPLEPRLQESITEVRGAAEKAFAKVQKAFDAYAEKKNAANLKTLKYAIANAAGGIEFAGNSLTKHAENVVQKAKFDIEAAVLSQAKALGLEPGDISVPQLGEGDQS